MTELALGLFTVAGLVGTYRLLAGPRLADRIMAMDLLLISLMGGIVVQAARTGDTVYFILLVVIAIVGFTATVAASQFVQLEYQHDRSEQEHTAKQEHTGKDDNDADRR